MQDSNEQNGSMDQNGRSSSIQRFESFESFELMIKDCRVDILRGLVELVIRASPFAPGITHLEVNSLVRVHDRRRGTVTKIETNSKVATSNPHRQQSRGAKIMRVPMSVQVSA